MNKRALFLSTVLIAACSFSACILPPDNTAPRILSEQELTLLSELKQGKDYARAGRNDLAELHLREALLIAPNRASIIGDLGYVVQRQGRLDEAKRLYERALSSDPRALAARGNLARLLFMLGEDAAADREFKRFISDYFLHWKGTEELPPPGFTTVDLASAYRNLGIVAFNLGHIDDANCWFQEALNLSSAAYTPREYGRLLSFMERWDLAEQFYRQRLELGEGDAPDPVLLADYGIVLFAEKRFEEAEQVFQRIPGVQGVDAQTRLLARFMKRLTAKERGAQSVGAELNEEIAEELSQESANYCETDFSAEYTYWPPEVVQKAAKYLDEICGRESSDVKEVNE